MLKNNDLNLTTRVSGKSWKRPRKSTNSLLQKIHRKSLDEKMKLKTELSNDRQRKKEAKEFLAQQKREKREKMQEMAQKRLENERRNETVVEIKNMAKLKRMKRSQLRSIEKRDLK